MEVTAQTGREQAREIQQATNTTVEVSKMRKIVAGLCMSVDGVVESPEQWQILYFNEEMGQAIGAQMAESDTLLLGRRTYQEFAAFWPNQPSDAPFAGYMNSTPKLVVSTTLDTVEWEHSTLLKGDVAAELAMLKQQPGRNLNVTGSGTLVRYLLGENLLDELQLMVCPVVVGRGRHLFEDGGDQKALNLVSSESFSTGVLQLTYQPAGT
jgi:dihydrofolate reductase